MSSFFALTWIHRGQTSWIGTSCSSFLEPGLYAFS